MKMRAELQLLCDKGHKQICVYIVEGEQIHGRHITTLYYDNINQIDISSVWNDWEYKKQQEFQLDFLDKLRNFSEGFVVSKFCQQAKDLIDFWVKSKKINVERVELPVRKVRTLPQIKIHPNMPKAKLEDFNPNDFVWAWRFI